MHYLLPGSSPKPTDIFRILAQRSHCVWMDSSDQRTTKRSRWSILAAEPRETLSHRSNPDFIKNLSDAIEKQREPQVDELPFHGGWIGHLEYCSEMPPYPSKSPLPIRGWFGYYDRALLWDHHKQETWLVSTRNVDRDELDRWYQKIEKENNPAEAPPQSSHSTTNTLNKVPSKREYMDRVRRVKEWIASGDIYQVNLAQFMDTVSYRPAEEIYLSLRESNPAPYAAYLDCGEYQILSSSPESFLHLDGRGKIQTSPIKGTRPRGRSISEDEALARDLVTDEKEKAELLMIVDMERSDLGRICSPGSVVVRDLYQLETYQSVHHLVADIEGKLLSGITLEDMLRATFPGGSITGAPKYRAMQIIKELENVDREPFCGSIGYFGVDGQAQCNIAIRTMRKTGNRLEFGVGAGIVWDSDPASEYKETWYKAERLLEALGHSSEY